MYHQNIMQTMFILSYLHEFLTMKLLLTLIWDMLSCDAVLCYNKVMKERVVRTKYVERHTGMNNASACICAYDVDKVYFPGVRVRLP